MRKLSSPSSKSQSQDQKDLGLDLDQGLTIDQN